MIAAARPYLLLAAAISFGLGISLPLIRFEKFWFFNETPSLIGVVAGLWQDGSMALSAVVALVSIAFPVLKMALAFRSAESGEGLPGWAGVLAKWSMMDVLLVAIFIFAAKTSGLASAVTQPGIWFYAISAVCLAVASR